MSFGKWWLYLQKLYRFSALNKGFLSKSPMRSFKLLRSVAIHFRQYFIYSHVWENVQWKFEQTADDDYLHDVIRNCDYRQWRMESMLQFRMELIFNSRWLAATAAAVAAGRFSFERTETSEEQMQLRPNEMCEIDKLEWNDELSSMDLHAKLSVNVCDCEINWSPALDVCEWMRMWWWSCVAQVHCMKKEPW